MKKNMLLAGLLGAMVLFTTAYILHIPIGSSGGYIHLGDTMVYMAAAAIGGGLADVLSGAAAWALPTVIIKAIMVLPFTAKKPTFLCVRNLLAPLAAGAVGIGGYFVAECVLVRLAGSTWAAAAVGAAASILPNGMQEIAGAVAFLALGAAMDRLGVKERLARLGGE